MDSLWAPWRQAYITTTPPAAGGACFICEGLAADKDRDNLIALRTPHTVVLLNRFPYNNGHLLVAPLSHKGRLQELSPKEMLEIQETLRRLVMTLDELMHPEGYNIGVNLGRVAGAGLPGHLHWHLVPRWNGDTNFMPVLSDAKVISQSLDSLYDLLVGHLSSGNSPAAHEHRG
jgi:ATP adenylyltransferase